jgi:hypothetical protein
MVINGDSFFGRRRNLTRIARIFTNVQPQMDTDGHRWTRMNQQLGLVDEWEQWIAGWIGWLYQARLGWIGLDYQGVAKRAECEACRVRSVPSAERAECGMRNAECGVTEWRASFSPRRHRGLARPLAATKYSTTDGHRWTRMNQQLGWLDKMDWRTEAERRTSWWTGRRGHPATRGRRDRWSVFYPSQRPV